MSRAAQHVELPDGTSLWAPSAVEAAVLYQQLAEESIYARHGIEVADGDCIFDVGANIGLYSVLLARAFHDLQIFAFEPVAPTYALLERNLALRGGDASIRLFKCALGREAGTAQGEVDPGLSFGATLRPRDVARAARPSVSVVEFAQALRMDLARCGQLSARWADVLQRGFGSAITRPLAVVGVLAVAAGARWRSAGGLSLRKRGFTCGVRTLSDVIREHDVKTIDLLKIDVEGSEWDILAGLEPALWPRVRQVVVEVHDVDGRVGQIEDFLRTHGFQTWSDPEDWAVLQLMGIYTVYARRPA
jgi:31-O-methyltransferase